MGRLSISILLVFLMLAVPWSAYSSPNSEFNEPASVEWTAEQAAQFWQVATPSSGPMVPISSSSGQIHTVLGSFDPLVDSPPLPPIGFADSLDIENTRLVIVQLKIHDYSIITELSDRLGLVDLDHIPDTSYLLRLPTDDTQAAQAINEMTNHPDIRSLVVQHPGWRLSPELMELSLAALNGEATPTVDANLVLAEDVTPESLESLLSDLESTGAETVHCDAWLCQIREIDPAWFSVIANDGRILFTEPHSQIVIGNNYARNLVRVDQVVNNYNGGLDGSGEVAAVSDTGLDGDHGDFTNRLISIYNQFGPDNSGADSHSGHGTHVAATFLGDGNGDSSTKGIAPATTFHFYQLEHDQSGQMARWGSLYDMFRHSRQQGANAQTNSWGSENMGGQYNSDSRSVDSFMDNYGDFTVLFAAGNEGSQGQNTVAPPSTAKNVLTVGASTTGRPGTASAGQVASFSSRGTTLDGRIKPDVVAPGVQICSARAQEAQYPAGFSCSSSRHPNNDPMYMSADGSSASTPVVAGTSVLVRQYLRTQMSLNSPRSDLVKAILINGAKDLGSADIPNNDEGWGQVDLERSIYPHSGILSLNTFYDQSQSLTPGYSYLYTYSIDGAYGISVTLVWNDREGSSSASQSTPRLVNNLDLLVTAPDGTQYKGNVFNNGFSTTGGTADNLNNVERVKIGATQTGNWSIQVSNSGGGSQQYSVVITAMGNANPVSDLATIDGSLWCSAAEPLEGDQLLIGATWVNQAPSTTGAYRVTVEDMTTSMILRDENRSSLAGGSSDSLVFTHTFQSTGIHQLRLTLDANDDVDEPNDFTSGTNNNIFDMMLNVSAIGVRVTPYAENGQLPTDDTELAAAKIRTINPLQTAEANFQFKIANEGTATQEIDMRVTPVQFVTPSGMLDAPSDEWLKFISAQPLYNLDPLGGVNDSIDIQITLRDESADLSATPYPTLALPGTYIVDVTAWYRSDPSVAHTIRLTVVVEEVAAMHTVLAGTTGLSAQPGQEATFFLSLLNPGNGPSIYNISCTTPNMWSIRLGDADSSSVTLEPLARLQSLMVSVKVMVPTIFAGQPAAGVTESVECITAHTTDASLSITDSAEVTVEVLESFSVELYSSDGTPVGPAGIALDEAVSNGQHLNLSAEIANQGNVPISLTVTVTPEQASWPLALECGSESGSRTVSISLSTGGFEQCKIEVLVPENVARGETNLINLRTQLSQSNFIQNRTELVVEYRPEIVLTGPESGLISANLGIPSYATFSVENTGNVELFLNWEVGSVPEDWQIGFHQMPPNVLGMHRSDSVELSAVIPARTAQGINSANIPIIVTATTADGEEIVRTASVAVQVEPTAVVTMVTDEDDFERLLNGESRTLNITVTNDGNTPCRVDFEINTTSEWTLAGLSSIQMLQVAESKTIEVTLTNVDATGSIIITITATPDSETGSNALGASLEISASSATLIKSSGLFSILDTMGIPRWVVGVVFLFILAALGATFIMLRKTGKGYDSGEDILAVGSGPLGSVEQRREAAIDTGLKQDDLVSGTVSKDEIASALEAAGPGKLAITPPPPPGKPPPPLGAPPPPPPPPK